MAKFNNYRYKYLKHNQEEWENLLGKSFNCQYPGLALFKVTKLLFQSPDEQIKKKECRDVKTMISLYLLNVKHL